MSMNPLIQLYKHKNIVVYGGFKKSISGYTHNRMQIATIKDLFLSAGERRETIVLFGPIERAN
jgi:hypothetical protein